MSEQDFEELRPALIEYGGVMATILRCQMTLDKFNVKIDFTRSIEEVCLQIREIHQSTSP